MKTPLRFYSATLPFAAALLAVTPLCSAQGLDPAPTVPVNFQALVTAVPTYDSGNPAFARITALGVSGASDSAQGEDYRGGELFTSVGFARVRPGRTHLFEISSQAVSRLRVKVTPPPGHRVFINGVEHEMFDWALGDGGILPDQGFFSVRIDDGGGGPVGEAPSLRPGRILWSVALGTLRNGRTAGSLRLASDGLTADTFRPASLYFDRDGPGQDGCYVGEDGEVLVVKRGGVLRQIYATSVLADIVPLSATSYAIRLYPRLQVGVQGADLTWAVTGEPLHEFILENPVAPALTALRVTRRTSQNGNLTMWTQLTRQSTAPAGGSQWIVDDWVEKAAGATAVTSPVRHRWTYTDSDRNELFEILDETGAVVRSTFRRYADLNFGTEVSRELEQEVQGHGGSAPIRTDYTYHTSLDRPGNWRRLRSVTSSDGSWAAFDYHDDFVSRGRIRQVRRPYGDLPASDPGADAASGHVTTHTYAHTDHWGTRVLPTRVETRVSGVVTARSEFSYADEFVTDAATAYRNAADASLPVRVTERRDYSAEGKFLTTRLRAYREDADPQFRFFPGLARSVENPDRTMTAHLYYPAAFNGETDPFSPLSSASGRVHVTLQGTHDATAGQPAPALPIASQSQPANFRVLDGKSRQVRVLMGEQGLPLVSEQQVLAGTWTVVSQEFMDYTASLLHRGTRRRNARDGMLWPIVTRTWTAGRVTTSVDEHGTVLNHTHDALSRLAATVREGASADGTTLAPLTTRFSYDAAGELSRSTIISGTEALVSANGYDTAGRLIRESAPGRGETTHTHAVEARTRTTVLPDGATRIETRRRDGNPASLTGTAVVAEYREQAVEADGRMRLVSRVRTASDARAREMITDWVGRPARRGEPGFGSNPARVEELTYDATTGLPAATSRTGYALRRFQHNALGEMVRDGLDLEGDGLVTASMDRINDLETAVESFEGALWLTTTRWIYPHAQSATRVTSSIERRRLTGLSASLREETRTTDREGNVTTRTVNVDAAARRVVISVSAPGLARPATEVRLAGLTISETGHDGLAKRFTYDASGRLESSTDPRSGRWVTTYHPGTDLPDEMRDPAGRLVEKKAYDALGRVIFTRDAADRTSRTAYTPRGELWRRWGSGVTPVAYAYDGYGQRTHQHLYRDETATRWEAVTWPGEGLTSQVTEWEHEAATGLLMRKYDAERKFTEWSYNERGQPLRKTLARRVNGTPLTVSYRYVAGTGEAAAVSYSDGTPAVNYEAGGYTRLGQPRTIADATGSRAFEYDSAAPWRLAAEVLPAFYGVRRISSVYEETTGTPPGATSLPGHVLASVKGRPAGFRLGANPTASSFDLELIRSTADTGRSAGVLHRRAHGVAARQFAYGYEPTPSGAPSALIRSLTAAGTTWGLNRAYDPVHDVLTSVETAWNGVVQSRHAYQHNAVALRETSVQSGEAFADLGPIHHRFSYGSRGELRAAYAYAGTDPASTALPLASRLFDYAHDAAGNRLAANPSGDAVLRDDSTADALNRFRQRENNALFVSGTVSAAPGVRVAVSGPATVAGGQLEAGKAGGHWGTGLVVNNLTSPFAGSVTAFAVLPGGGAGGTDLVRRESREFFLPPIVQSFTYDEDGNLTSDGVWDYAWDAENRLVRMSATAITVAAGRPALTLTFQYDHLGRRVRKEVRSGTSLTLVSERRYLYDGWNIIAELDGAAAIRRTFSWGLDLNGGSGTAGGVGGLLQIHDADAGKTFLPAFDGNGNVTALLNADTGAIEASYEYSPFGELLRATGPYAAANPLRFSTKWQDEETGLLYYGYRYYAPREGRFISRDPIEERGGLNLYAFCGNDGINRWDYLGQLSLKGFLKKAWKPLVAIGAGVLTAGTAMYAYALATGGAGATTFGGMLSSVGLASGWGPAWASVAGGGFGFGSSFAGARLSGAGTSDALRAGLRGAATGAAVAYTVSQVVAGVDAWRHDTHQFYRVEVGGVDQTQRSITRIASSNIEGSVRIFENGILNDLDRAVTHGLNHFERESFILAHNPTRGGLADIVETALGKLTGTSSVGRDLAGVLGQIDPASSSLYLHSQGAQIGMNALKALVESGGSACGLEVFGYGGATHLTTSR
ncbi:MAG: RHS repeat-associated core domain-containing protein, partial [Opitutaceae bacterium]